jgi:hypothetical protein
VRVTVDNAAGSGLEPELGLRRDASRFFDRLRILGRASDGYDRARSMSLIAFAAIIRTRLGISMFVLSNLAAGRAKREAR